MIDDGVAAQPILYGIFRALLDRNVPVRVSDYLDALRALRQGFGGPVESSGQPRHANLCWLCEVLWARDEIEVRLIRDLFAAIEPATVTETADFEKWLGLTITQPQLDDQEQPDPDSSEGTTIPLRGSSADTVPPSEVEAPLRVEVEAPHLKDGWRLPLLPARLRASEAFVLEPETVLPMRTLAAAWRLLRSLARTGPKVELDVDATIAGRCREGMLGRPVMRAQRRNRSSLFVLADVSTSMGAWLPLIGLVEQSLPLGRLQVARILYFANVPRTSVFDDRALSKPISLDQLYCMVAGARIIVVSDAGSARGFLNYRRADQTLRFLTRITAIIRAAVWLNPMPPHRWHETTAEQISSMLPMLPLTRQGLSLGIDILRGLKSP
jgi:uncharacterized protein with von Willebrand factor type A (vWA) domain